MGSRTCGEQVGVTLKQPTRRHDTRREPKKRKEKKNEKREVTIGEREYMKMRFYVIYVREHVHTYVCRCVHEYVHEARKKEGTKGRLVGLALDSGKYSKQRHMARLALSGKKYTNDEITFCRVAKASKG